MSYDELELDKLGDEKSALFFLISDTDTTYNFLVALAFSQMFNLLCERADNTYGGRLPYHVRVLWDEAANTCLLYTSGSSAKSSLGLLIIALAHAQRCFWPPET